MATNVSATTHYSINYSGSVKCYAIKIKHKWGEGVTAAALHPQSISKSRARCSYSSYCSAVEEKWTADRWTEQNPLLSLLSVPLNQSFVTSLRETHTCSAHRRSSDVPSVYLLCSRQLTSRGHIPSQPVCDGQVDTQTLTHTHTHLADLLDSHLLTNAGLPT